jgi:hypothetical protein
MRSAVADAGGEQNRGAHGETGDCWFELGEMKRARAGTVTERAGGVFARFGPSVFWLVQLGVVAGLWRMGREDLPLGFVWWRRQ